MLLNAPFLFPKDIKMEISSRESQRRPNLRIVLDHTPIVVTPGKHRIIFKGTRCYSSSGRIIFSSTSDFFYDNGEWHPWRNDPALPGPEESPVPVSVGSISTANSASLPSTTSEEKSSFFQDHSNVDKAHKNTKSVAVHIRVLPPRPSLKATHSRRTVLKQQSTQSDSELNSILYRRKSFASPSRQARSEGQVTFKENIVRSPIVRPATITEKLQDEVETPVHAIVRVKMEHAYRTSQKLLPAMVPRRPSQGITEYRRSSTKSHTALQGKQISEIYGHRYSSGRSRESSDSINEKDKVDNPQLIHKPGCFPSIKARSIFTLWRCSGGNRTRRLNNRKDAPNKPIERSFSNEGDNTVSTVLNKQSLASDELGRIHSKDDQYEAENKFQLDMEEHEGFDGSNVFQRSESKSESSSQQTKEVPANSFLPYYYSHPSPSSKDKFTHNTSYNGCSNEEKEQNHAREVDSITILKETRQDSFQTSIKKLENVKSTSEKRCSPTDTFESMHESSVGSMVVETDISSGITTQTLSPGEAATRDAVKMLHLKRVASVQGRKLMA